MTDGRLRSSSSRPPAGACSHGAVEEASSRDPGFAVNEGVWPCGGPRAPRPCTSGRSCASMCPEKTPCSFWRLKQPALSSHCRALLASWWRQWLAFMLGCGHCRLSACPSLLPIEMTAHRSGHSGGAPKVGRQTRRRRFRGCLRTLVSGKSSDITQAHGITSNIHPRPLRVTAGPLSPVPHVTNR